MSPEKTKMLMEKYSELFYESDDESSELLPFSMFGFECDDGWFEVVDSCLKDIASLRVPGVKIDQIKEKYGTLRVYTNHTTTEMCDIIAKYEDISEKTCEVCGKPGTLSTKGWRRVSCEEHK
jgi:hypothetical protein